MLDRAKTGSNFISKMADGTGETVPQEKTSCTFFKKSKNRRNVRKRQAEKSDSDEGESSVVVRKEKKVNSSNPMIQKSEGLKHGRKEENIRVDFESTRSAMSSGPTDLGATATYELDTDFDRDAQAVYAKSLEVNKEIKESECDDKIYKGINNYMQFYEKKDTALGNAASGMVRLVLWVSFTISCFVVMLVRYVK